jgi:hypothetical protein
MHSTLRTESNTTPDSSFISANSQHSRHQSSTHTSSSNSMDSQHNQHIRLSRETSRTRATDRSQSRDTRLSRSPVRSLANDGTARGRHRNRLSLTAVSNVLFRHGRSNSPFTPRQAEKDDSGRGRSKEKRKAKETRPPFIRVSGVLGLDGEDGKETHGWKVFKKGNVYQKACGDRQLILSRNLHVSYFIRDSGRLSAIITIGLWFDSLAFESHCSQTRHIHYETYNF